MHLILKKKNIYFKYYLYQKMLLLGIFIFENALGIHLIYNQNNFK